MSYADDVCTRATAAAAAVTSSPDNNENTREYVYNGVTVNSYVRVYEGLSAEAETRVRRHTPRVYAHAYLD